MLTALSGSFGSGMRLLLGNLWLFKPLVVWLMPRFSGYGAALMRTTSTFTMCGGSDACNVIPAEAYVVANLRTGVHQGEEDSLKILSRYAKKHRLDMTVLQSRDASSLVDIRGKAYTTLHAAISTYFPDIGVCPYWIMGGTDARHFHAVSDAPLRFSPIRMNSAQEKSCHAVDENIRAASLTEGVGFFQDFLRSCQPWFLSFTRKKRTKKAKLLDTQTCRA